MTNRVKSVPWGGQPTAVVVRPSSPGGDAFVSLFADIKEKGEMNMIILSKDLLLLTDGTKFAGVF